MTIDVLELARSLHSLDDLVLTEATPEPTGVHGLPRATLADLIAHLKKVYAGPVGLEFMHISSPSRRTWLAEHMEVSRLLPAKPVRLRMLELLINAEQFERFCHTKYP